MSYQERQNEGKMGALMLGAMVFAYLFLVAQHESWWVPVPVMLSVAFALLGALLGLWLRNDGLGVYAQLGMVMLIGLAAKNAILMVELSRDEREVRRVGIEEVARNGASLRFRAVLMTALSFLIGVFPMVISTGAGAESRRIIGLTTFSGMLMATVIGIIFISALYSACQENGGNGLNKKWGGKNQIRHLEESLGGTPRGKRAKPPYWKRKQAAQNADNLGKAYHAYFTQFSRVASSASHNEPSQISNRGKI